MIERSYHLSDRGGEIARETDLGRVIRSLETDITEEFSGWRRSQSEHDPVETLAQEVLTSQYFEDLTAEEQGEVLRSINRFSRGDDLSWVVESEQREANLLDAPQATRREKAVPTDLVVLIGAAALDFYETEECSWLENWQARGFKSRLEAATLATAVALEEGQSGIKEKGGEFSYDISANTRRNIWVGGTLHGDFRISQKDTHPNGAITPTGRDVEFAPSPERTTVGAYHSVEPLIAESVIKHIYFTNPQEAALAEVLADVSSRIEESGSIQVGNFADYGTENTRRIVKTFIEDKQRWMAQPPHISKEGRTLDQYILNPGRDAQYLKLVSFQDRLRFSQSYSQPEGTDRDKQFIDIPNEYIDDLLVALHEQARSGAGRTRPATIASIIQAAL